MKCYGWKNSRVNILMGTHSGGEWAEVSRLHYLWLLICGYKVKKEKP